MYSDLAQRHFDLTGRSQGGLRLRMVDDYRDRIITGADIGRYGQ